MSFSKYGSDPKGSEHQKLERLEAENQIKKAKLDEQGFFHVEEEHEVPNLFGEKDTTPAEEQEEETE